MSQSEKLSEKMGTWLYPEKDKFSLLQQKCCTIFTTSNTTILSTIYIKYKNSIKHPTLKPYSFVELQCVKSFNAAAGTTASEKIVEMSRES